MAAPDYIRWFADLRMRDVPLVGGKTASLGELHSMLSAEHISVPNGFAVTAQAYREAMAAAGAWDKLHEQLDDLDKTDVDQLARRAAACRRIVYEATGGKVLARQIRAAYAALEAEYGKSLSVAVRSSATAEDLPNASFAGQHESYLNVRGPKAAVEACRRCFASLFTDRAIIYRINNGFDHFKVYLSVAVMKMVRSDIGASGVIFTLDTESGFRDVVFITGSYGLGESVVQGLVDPDEFYVHKPTYREGSRAILQRRLGAKQTKLVYGRGLRAATRELRVPAAARAQFCIDDADALALAGHAISIEDHYSQVSGHAMPMDIEWARDGEDGKLYIVQARPETVASQRGAIAESYTLNQTGKLLATGRAIGEKIATGTVRVIADIKDLNTFQPGEILVADTTTPDWQPVMKTAGAIVTDRGGRTCHAAIVARELGVAAVVGAGNATKALKTGDAVTVSCAEGEAGHIYEGTLEFEVTRTDISSVPRPQTRIMVNLGNPDLAFRSAMLPNDGVGLARMEFIINESIAAHPMALAHPERIESAAVRRKIARLTQGFDKPGDFFVQKLSEGVGTIAAAF